jgi:hypothetical protein
MPMPPRFKEICQLLIQGTENGSLKWSSFSDIGTLTTRLGDNLFTISQTGPLGEVLRQDEADRLVGKLTLRILNSNGDELDSVGIRNGPDDDGFDTLSKLLEKAASNRDKLLSSRLQPVTEALRAAVLAGASRK